MRLGSGDKVEDGKDVKNDVEGERRNVSEGVN